jgi:hypothetical protein
MGTAKRQGEEFEELRHRLEQVALGVGAIRYDNEEDNFVSLWNGDAERHAYARATRQFRGGRLNLAGVDLPEIRELLGSILNEIRLGRYDA